MHLFHEDKLEPRDIDPGFGDSGLPRSDGIHVTPLIDRILERAFGRPSFSGGEQWNKFNLFEAGFVWEEFLEEAFARRRTGIIRPDEVVKDGIAGSPDGYNVKTGELYEYKFTFKSSSMNMLDQRRWIMQAKSYCHMMSSENRKVRRVNWMVFFVNGNYKGSGPLAKVFKAEFDDREIKVHWKQILKERDKVLEEEQ